MSGYEPKVSPVTGKFILIGVLEVIGYMDLEKLYFVTIENYEADAVAIRSFDNYCGICGWFKKTEARVMKLIK